MIDKHSYEQVQLKVEPKSFLYEFLNSGDPLYKLKVGKFQADQMLFVGMAGRKPQGRVEPLPTPPPLLLGLKYH